MQSGCFADMSDLVELIADIEETFFLQWNTGKGGLLTSFLQPNIIKLKNGAYLNCNTPSIPGQRKISMKFEEALNHYMNILQCTAQDLSIVSGLSAATLSRYRSGGRIPASSSEPFHQLCYAISKLACDKNLNDITYSSVRDHFLHCSNMTAVQREWFCRNLNSLFSVLDINITRLSHYTNYDISTISRFRNGSRYPADPVGFASNLASYVANEKNSDSDIAVLSKLLHCTDSSLSSTEACYTRTKSWLLSNSQNQEGDNTISQFLSKLDHFDLNEYIKVIHFDTLKLPPTIPFQLPGSKYYYGLAEMMESELDFLKATVLSRSAESVIMYSDMPMEEMSKDPDFPKKWMFGMAMMLKKGLHLYQIHDLNRSSGDMMLGLESWIPMYMTGQISPYYLKNNKEHIFSHLLKVSGSAALSGESVCGHHKDGRYYLTKSKDEIAYYRKQANDLLASASPLMDIYRKEQSSVLNAFLQADSHTPGIRRNLLSSLPVYTMTASFLKSFLQRRNIPEREQSSILSYAADSRKLTENILHNGQIIDEIPFLSADQFQLHPLSLSLSGSFQERDLAYTYEEYQEHLAMTKQFALSHPNYTFTETGKNPFHNLQISIHEGVYAMISKNKAPAIHFVIHHPRLLSAIESFSPPITDQEITTLF